MFALLDPDPDPDSKSGSGSSDPIESGSNPDPDPQPCTKHKSCLPGAKSETVPVPELVCIMALAIMFT